MDVKLRSIIDKLAEKIVKLGPSFEDNIKEKQPSNPLFSFLDEEGEYYDYYKWKIFDIRRQQNEINNLLPPWEIGLPELNLSRLMLNQQEKAEFFQILDTLEPNEVSIKGGKDWIMNRSEHTYEICTIMADRCNMIHTFNGKLHIVYLINDVLLHSRGKPNDFFTNAVLPFLGRIFKTTLESASIMDEQQKVHRMFDIWKEKNIYDDYAISQIRQETLSFNSEPAYHNVPPPTKHGNSQHHYHNNDSPQNDNRQERRDHGRDRNKNRGRERGDRDGSRDRERNQGNNDRKRKKSNSKGRSNSRGRHDRKRHHRN